MRARIAFLVVAALFAAFTFSTPPSALADTFGSGGNTFTIDFVDIGNAGNAANPLTGLGAVGYEFRMGKFVISIDQVAAATANGLANVPLGGWSLGYHPAGALSWYQAAAFVNWLNDSKGHSPAYNLMWDGSSWSMNLWQPSDLGYNPSNPFRNSQAYYFLPSIDEWHKAAFGKADGSGYWLYATASDMVPTGVASGTSAETIVINNDWSMTPADVTQAGGLSDYGTMGQTGNTFQWIETASDGTNDSATENRSTGSLGYWYKIYGSGGDFDTGPSGVASTYEWDTAPDNIAYPYMAFRVASVPEPSTYALLLMAGAGALWWSRRKR